MLNLLLSLFIVVGLTTGLSATVCLHLFAVDTGVVDVTVSGVTVWPSRFVGAVERDSLNQVLWLVVIIVVVIVVLVLVVIVAVVLVLVVIVAVVLILVLLLIVATIVLVLILVVVIVHVLILVIAVQVRLSVELVHSPFVLLC